MSYDVSVGSFDANYTSNLANMFHEHIRDEHGNTGFQCLHDRTGKEAAAILSSALDSIHRGCHYEKYDAPNGWGSAAGGILFIARIMAACVKHPDDKVYVSA
jgi:hypothetical protein